MRIAYFRTSAPGQSVEAQRHAMGGTFDLEFTDEFVSGGVLAADRPGWRELMGKIRKGDTVCVFAVDRLGRDAIDIQATARQLMALGVTVDILGIGPLVGDAGELVLAVMASFAQSERNRIRQRTSAGMAAAQRSLAETGQTQHGRTRIGRAPAADPFEVNAWRSRHGASIPATCARFKISRATVLRYARKAAQALEAAP